MVAGKAKKIAPTGIPKYEPIPVKPPAWMAETIRLRERAERGRAMRLRRQEEAARAHRELEAARLAKIAKRYQGLAAEKDIKITRAIYIVESVCEVVSEAFSWDDPITIQDLATKGRSAQAVLARSMCALLLREMTILSWPMIVKAYGKNGHAQAIESSMRLRAGLDADLDVASWKKISLCQQACKVKLRDLVENARRRAESRGKEVRSQTPPSTNTACSCDTGSPHTPRS